MPNCARNRSCASGVRAGERCLPGYHRRGIATCTDRRLSRGRDNLIGGPGAVDRRRRAAACRFAELGCMLTPAQTQVRDTRYTNRAFAEMDVSLCGWGGHARSSTVRPPSEGPKLCELAALSGQPQNKADDRGLRGGAGHARRGAGRTRREANMAEAASSAAEAALENQRIGGLQLRVAALCTSCRSATATT